MQSFSREDIRLDSILLYVDAPVTNWWTNWDNQIAFSRGNRAFLAINKSGYDMSGSFNTGMPEGSYCNVNAGEVVNNKCTGYKIKFLKLLYRKRYNYLFSVCNF